MSFGQPYVLIGLIAVPLLMVLLAWGERQKRLSLSRLGDARLVARLNSSVNYRARRWRHRLLLLAVASLIVALARPQWGSATEIVSEEGVQVVFLLDVSNSMLARDVQPDRLTRAKQEAAELIERLEDAEIGVVLFAADSSLQFAPTNSRRTVRAFVDSANPASIRPQGTAVGDAIIGAQELFDERRPSQKVIILMSDGEDHGQNSRLAAAQAAAAGVLIYAMGFGGDQPAAIPLISPTGELIGERLNAQGNPIRTRLNEPLLQAIAEQTGGKYVRADASGTSTELIAGELRALESARIERRFEAQLVERHQLFVASAIGLVAAAELLTERRRGSV